MHFMSTGFVYCSTGYCSMMYNRIKVIFNAFFLRYATRNFLAMERVSRLWSSVAVKKWRSTSTVMHFPGKIFRPLRDQAWHRSLSCPQLYGPQIDQSISLRSLHLGVRRTSGTGLRFKGQGLKNHEPPAINSPFLKRFIDNRKREQEWGKRYFPWAPDILFFLRFAIVSTCGLTVGWIFYPEFKNRRSALDDPTLVRDSAIQLRDKKGAWVKFYSSLPLRLLSRAWGRIHRSSNIPHFLRPHMYGLYSKVYGVNIDEAVDPDLKSYSNFSEFFVRAIKSSERPIDQNSELVSPADGKVLHFGEIIDGAVEQVKGVTYSLQKFLGPLHMEPIHDEWEREPGYRYCWSSAPLRKYTKALMHDPVKNSLYHCVIYLAPGDYHRFHSPADWVVQHRRHFPGDLLSVSPKIAALVPSLFVLNERVVLRGKWKHGFFSMTAVGATNVGSVVIYGDITLNTNRPKRVYGGYYDKEYGDIPVEKGVGMGEFNFGSTIVLIFEAPKEFQYALDAGDKILYGKRLQN